MLAQILAVVGNTWVGTAAPLGRSQAFTWIAAMLLFYLPFPWITLCFPFYGNVKGHKERIENWIQKQLSTRARNEFGTNNRIVFPDGADLDAYTQAQYRPSKTVGPLVPVRSLLEGRRGRQ